MVRRLRPHRPPEIAFAVLIEGDTPDESFAGGLYAAPVVKAMLAKWWEKKQRGDALVAPRFCRPHPRAFFNKTVVQIVRGIRPGLRRVTAAVTIGR